MSRKSVDANIDARQALAHFEAVASVNLNNGVFLVETGAARDHADMRASQLSSLLMLMRMDDARGFGMLGEAVQANVMWLASQLADELKGMLPIVAEEARQEARA
jgi:hypothetical protein